MQRKLDNYIQSSAELWAKTMFFTTSEFCSATSNLTVCGRVLQWAWPVCRVTVTWSGSLPELVCGWCTSPRVARCLYRSICCRRPSLFAMRGMYSDNSSSTTAINCWTTPRRPTERLSSKYDTTYISVCHRSVPSKQNKKPSCRYDSQPYCLTAPSVPTSVYHTLVVALVLSRLDYGNAVLVGLPAYLSTCTTVCSQCSTLLRDPSPVTRRSDHITDTLASFYWLKVPERIQFKLATIVYRSLNGTAPRYVLQICAVCLICRLPDDVWDRHSLTSSMSVSRSVQLLETELSLWLAGARLWNSLPHDIVASDTLSHFRRGLKTFLFRQSCPSILF